MKNVSWLVCVSPNILYMVQTWTLTGTKREPDGQCGQEHCLLPYQNTICVFHFRKRLFNCEKQAFPQYYPVFQSINWLFTVKELTSTSSWKGSPHHGTSSFMLNCGRDAFTIVFLTRSSNTPLWRSACNWNLDSSLHTTLLNHSESNFPYSALDNLLVIAVLERVSFSDVLNSAHSFCRLLFLSLRTVHFSRWSSLHDEALGLPDSFFLTTLSVQSVDLFS